jgi:hypothetical protein
MTRIFCWCVTRFTRGSITNDRGRSCSWGSGQPEYYCWAISEWYCRPVRRRPICPHLGYIFIERPPGANIGRDCHCGCWLGVSRWSTSTWYRSCSDSRFRPRRWARDLPACVSPPLSAESGFADIARLSRLRRGYGDDWSDELHSWVALEPTDLSSVVALAKLRIPIHRIAMARSRYRSIHTTTGRQGI